MDAGGESRGHSNFEGGAVLPDPFPDGRFLFFCGVGRGLSLTPPSRSITYQELIDNFRSVHNSAGNIYQIELSALGIER